MVPQPIRELLDGLPEDALVLDVGGWAETDPRADWVIDIGSHDSRGWYRSLGAEAATSQRVRAETWVQRDVCDPEPWPFEDGMFAVALCTQTLEDVRDPIRVCCEMVRVARAGYVETPGAAVELTRGIESPLWCGWKHHRWLVWSDGSGSLVFLAKPHHIHSPLWPSIPSPKQLTAEASRPFGLRWEHALTAREEVVVEQAELDRLLESIVRRSSRSDHLASARRAGMSATWTAYRAARSRAGRLRRMLQA